MGLTDVKSVQEGAFYKFYGNTAEGLPVVLAVKYSQHDIGFIEVIWTLVNTFANRSEKFNVLRLFNYVQHARVAGADLFFIKFYKDSSNDKICCEGFMLGSVFDERSNQMFLEQAIFEAEDIVYDNNVPFHEGITCRKLPGKEETMGVKLPMLSDGYPIVPQKVETLNTSTTTMMGSHDDAHGSFSSKQFSPNAYSPLKGTTYNPYPLLDKTSVGEQETSPSSSIAFLGAWVQSAKSINVPPALRYGLAGVIICSVVLAMVDALGGDQITNMMNDWTDDHWFDGKVGKHIASGFAFPGALTAVTGLACLFYYGGSKVREACGSSEQLKRQ